MITVTINGEKFEVPNECQIDVVNGKVQVSEIVEVQDTTSTDIQYIRSWLIALTIMIGWVLFTQ